MRRMLFLRMSRLEVVIAERRATRDRTVAADPVAAIAGGGVRITGILGGPCRPYPEANEHRTCNRPAEATQEAAASGSTGRKSSRQVIEPFSIHWISPLLLPASTPVARLPAQRSSTLHRAHCRIARVGGSYAPISRMEYIPCSACGRPSEISGKKQISKCVPA